MNWSAIGATGEIVGAIAVVITLIYLSRQIRENSRALHVAALRDTTAQWNQWSELVAMSADLADIVARGNRCYRDLSEQEALRYGAYAQTFFDNLESSRQLILEHGVDKNLDVIEAIARRRLASRGMAQWWQQNTGDYDDCFVNWIDGLR